MRGKRTGSVRIFIPKKLIKTVECPIHAAVRSSLVQLLGVGCAKAGAMGRRLSTIHSCQRCRSQLRRRIARRARSRSVSIVNNNACAAPGQKNEIIVAELVPSADSQDRRAPRQRLYNKMNWLDEIIARKRNDIAKLQTEEFRVRAQQREDFRD